MVFQPEALAVVVGFMVLANRLVEMLITPLFEKFEWDKFFIMYIAWVIAGVLVAFSQVNLFTEFIPNPIIGLVLTAIVAGGGSNLLHDLVDTMSAVEVTVLPEALD